MDIGTQVNLDDLKESKMNIWDSYNSLISALCQKLRIDWNWINKMILEKYPDIDVKVFDNQPRYEGYVYELIPKMIKKLEEDGFLMTQDAIELMKNLDIISEQLILTMFVEGTIGMDSMLGADQLLSKKI